MKINPSQSQSITSYSVGASKAVKKTAEPASVEAVGATQLSDGDIAKVKDTVKRLMAESAVRPEVVSGRTASDPVKAFDEESLRRFVTALNNAQTE